MLCIHFCYLGLLSYIISVLIFFFTSWHSFSIGKCTVCTTFYLCTKLLQISTFLQIVWSWILEWSIMTDNSHNLSKYSLSSHRVSPSSPPQPQYGKWTAMKTMTFTLFMMLISPLEFWLPYHSTLFHVEINAAFSFFEKY